MSPAVRDDTAHSAPPPASVSSQPSHHAPADSPEVLNLHCPQCHHPLNLRREHLGIPGHCVACGHPLVAVEQAGTVVLADPRQLSSATPSTKTAPEKFAPAATTETATPWQTPPASAPAPVPTSPAPQSPTPTPTSTSASFGQPEPGGAENEGPTEIASGFARPLAVPDAPPAETDSPQSPEVPDMATAMAGFTGSSAKARRQTTTTPPPSVGELPFPITPTASPSENTFGGNPAEPAATPSPESPFASTPTSPGSKERKG